MAMILAVPGDLPPVEPDVDLWPGLMMTWTGWDGTVWPLTGRQSGIRLGRVVRGLEFPPAPRYSSASPAVAGSRTRGHRVEDRRCAWDLRIVHTAGSQAWLDYVGAFMRTIQPGRTGVWSVTQPNGTTRQVALEAEHDGDIDHDGDGSRLGWARFPLRLLAPRPFWVGEPIERGPWAPGTQTPFLGPGGYGPPFYISSSTTIATATVTNPGDVDAWPVWRIDGPTSSVSVGVGGRVVQVSAPIAAGDYRIVDTRPDRLTIRDAAGANRLNDLGLWQPVPVPPGTEVPLSLAMTGTGSVSMSLEPLYYRATG